MAESTRPVGYTQNSCDNLASMILYGTYGLPNTRFLSHKTLKAVEATSCREDSSSSRVTLPQSMKLRPQLVRVAPQVGTNVLLCSTHCGATTVDRKLLDVEV